MFNDRRSFRRFSVFVFYVRRDARELSVRFIIRGCGKYLVRIDLDLIQWLGCDLRTLSYLIQWLGFNGEIFKCTSHEISFHSFLLAVSFFSTFPTCEVLHFFTKAKDFKLVGIIVLQGSLSLR
ncbi:hypothetical protein QL285_059668 [Trifolium repens]|nr:hypothetical protein QL285_059668 [Trifolium repens]